MQTLPSSSLALRSMIFQVKIVSHLRLHRMKKVLSTLDLTHVIKLTRLGSGLASSKVIRRNYCTRMNICKGGEPGNGVLCPFLNESICSSLVLFHNMKQGSNNILC